MGRIAVVARAAALTPAAAAPRSPARVEALAVAAAKSQLDAAVV